MLSIFLLLQAYAYSSSFWLYVFFYVKLMSFALLSYHILSFD